MIDALADHLREHNANVHRGVYALAQEADAAYDGARKRVAAFVGAEPETTIFTKNVTEAINLVAYSWGRGATDGRANVGPGDAVLITQMEHHANIVPWQVLCRERGAELRYLEVDERGEISLDQLDAELARGDVRMVAVTHVSNVLGTILPVAEIVARARAAGAVTLVDGAQAVPHMPVDVAAIGADFYAWTGHKALGPTGIGVLHGRREILEAMEPFLTGGDMIASVDFQGGHLERAAVQVRGRHAADRRGRRAGRGGRVPVATRHGARARARARVDRRTCWSASADVPGLRVAGPPEADARGGLASFTIEGMHPHDIAELADRGGVCIRAGHHCAQPLMRCLGVSATARASIGVYNEPRRHRRARRAPAGRARGVRALRWTTSTATTSSTTTSSRGTSASWSPTTSRRWSTTRCAATSWGCTSA